MILFNEKEESTTMVLYRHFREHVGACVRCRMEDGSVFSASFDTAYEGDNENDESFESGAEPYKEYLALVLRVLEIFEAGPNCPDAGTLIEVWYDRFPVEISDTSGNILYPAR